MKTTKENWKASSANPHPSPETETSKQTKTPQKILRVGENSHSVSQL